MAKKILTGIPVSIGIAIGKAYFINRDSKRRLPRMTITEEMLAAEENRLNRGFKLAEEDLMKARDSLPAEFRDHAAIIESHLMILKDPKLINSARRHIREHLINAEWALEKAVNDFETAFSAIEDEYIKSRIQDIVSVAERAQKRLIGDDTGIKTVPGKFILLAHDLTPADTVELEADKIMAFATALGGKTSHTGIMARSLQIPAVVGVSELEAEIEEGKLLIVDGLKGRILVEPDLEEIEEYRLLKLQFDNYQKSILRHCNLPGETIDGYQIRVLANIELYEEVAAVIDYGGEGIGLYRTEYSYLNRAYLPSEDDLTAEYKELATTLYPNRIVIRTLDLGADKLIKYFGNLEEANPAMGLRAIRFCLRHRELFKSQLRSILRASVVGNVYLMFPMISGLREFRLAKAILQAVQSELKRDGYNYNPDMPIGIMVEVPSVVMTADIMAKEVDFFSIGTNDLIQYTLGIDRTNKYVSYLYQPLHPAIVRSIKQVVDAAHQAGIEVSLCGELAADPFCIPIILGMGIDSISMNPQAIPGIKRIIRQTSMEECKELLKQVLTSASITQTNRMVRETIFRRFPEEITFFTSLLDSEEF